MVQVGRTGIEKGTAFWEAIQAESEAAKSAEFPFQQPNLHSLFQETSRGKLVPRTLLCDLESRTVLAALNRGRDRYLPHLAVYNELGSHSLYSRAFYSSGAEAVYPAVDAFRKLAEASDCLQNVFVVGNLGGGTGSGFSELLVSSLCDEYPGPLKFGELTYCSEAEEAVLPTYNTILSVGLQVELCGLVNIRQSSRNASFRSSEVAKVHLNGRLAEEGRQMALYTACMRYPGTLNGNIRKALTNLVPFPRVHFTNLSTTQGGSSKATDSELIRSLLHKNVVGQGKDVQVYTDWMNFQGSWSEYAVENEVFK